MCGDIVSVEDIPLLSERRNIGIDVSLDDVNSALSKMASDLTYHRVDLAFDDLVDVGHGNERGLSTSDTRLQEVAQDKTNTSGRSTPDGRGEVSYTATFQSTRC